MAMKRVGGEVDAFCNKCKMPLAHTILAMVGERVARVQCNTCNSQHAFKGVEAKVKKPRGSKASGAAPSKAALSFDQLLASKDVAGARRYSPKDRYAVDEVIDHPTFGQGVVLTARADKVDVIFKGSQKVLVHGRGGDAPAAQVSFSHPKKPTDTVADKPGHDHPDADLDIIEGAGDDEEPVSASDEPAQA